MVYHELTGHFWPGAFLGVSTWAVVMFLYQTLAPGRRGTGAHAAFAWIAGICVAIIVFFFPFGFDAKTLGIESTLRGTGANRSQWFSADLYNGSDFIVTEVSVLVRTHDKWNDAYSDWRRFDKKIEIQPHTTKNFTVNTGLSTHGNGIIPGHYQTSDTDWCINYFHARASLFHYLRTKN